MKPEPAVINRRKFITTTAAGLALAGAASLGAAPLAWAKKDPFGLPALPYPQNALEPTISARTLGFHHGKHHAGYVKKLNAAIVGKPYEAMSLEEIILKSHQDGDTGVFNNAAQDWNHTFYWNCMTPGGGGQPKGLLAAKIQADFGSFENFRAAFKQAATSQFGSGWAWLIQASTGKLSVVNTANAGTPLTTPGARPLLTIDVWEHAYYLDWQNRRAAYIDAWLDKLVNWEFATTHLKT